MTDLKNESVLGTLTSVIHDQAIKFYIKQIMEQFVTLLPGAISEMIATVADTHTITKADRYGLMAAILDDSLSEEDRRCIDRLLRSLRRGHIQVVDDISALT